MPEKKLSDKSILGRTISRRGLLKVGVEAAKIGAVAWIAHVPDKNPIQRSNKSINLSPVPPANKASPLESSPTPKIDEATQERFNAVESFKEQLKLYPGLLNDNPELKKIIEDPKAPFNENQVSIKHFPDKNATYYTFKLDPNAAADSKPDFKFLKHANRPGMYDMLNMEFNFDKSGKLILGMGAAEVPLTNNDLKEVIGRMMEFAPKEWDDRKTFDPVQHIEVENGIEGVNGNILIQAEPTGHIMVTTFTRARPPQSQPSIVPKRGEVQII